MILTMNFDFESDNFPKLDDIIDMIAVNHGQMMSIATFCKCLTEFANSAFHPVKYRRTAIDFSELGTHDLAFGDNHPVPLAIKASHCDDF